MAKDVGKIKEHSSNEIHQAAVESYKNRAEGRPKQFWDEDSKSWIREAV